MLGSRLPRRCRWRRFRRCLSSLLTFSPMLARIYIRELVRDANGFWARAIRTSQNAVKPKFAEKPFHALGWARATKVQKRHELAANAALCHASSRMERRRPRGVAKRREPKFGEPRRWRSFGAITYPVHPQSLSLWRKR